MVHRNNGNESIYTQLFYSSLGTGPNLIVKGQLDTFYGSEHGVNFSSWMIFSFPLMVACLMMTWIFLQLLYLGPRAVCECFFKKQNTAADDAASAVIQVSKNHLTASVPNPLILCPARRRGYFQKLSACIKSIPPTKKYKTRIFNFVPQKNDHISLNNGTS